MRNDDQQIAKLKTTHFIAMILFLIVCGFLFYFNQLYVVLNCLHAVLLVTSVSIGCFTMPNNEKIGNSYFYFYEKMRYDQFYNLFLVNIDILFVNLVIVILASYFNKPQFTRNLVLFGFITLIGLVTFLTHKFIIEKLYVRFKNINLKEID